MMSDAIENAIECIKALEAKVEGLEKKLELEKHKTKS